MISILDPRAWIAAIALCAASVGLGYWRGNVAGKGAVQARWDAAVIAWDDANKKQEQVYAQAIEKAIAERDAKLKAIQSDAVAARAAAGSMRDQLTEARRGLAAHSPATVLDYATAATDVLQECTGRYSAVAEKADGHAADAEALIRAWPSGGGSP
ncbi:MAG: hypothetical protein ACK5NE_08090 [Brachymonas sp.]